MKKILKIFAFVILIFIILTNTVYALDLNDINGKVNQNQIVDTGQKIITIVSVVGSITAVIVLVLLGIRYMLGSVEEKATYKKTLLPYVIGAVFVFAGSSIAGIVYNFFK